MNTTNDSIDFIHPDYQAHANQVEVCNDIYNGIDTAQKYLIQRPMEDDEDFANRKAITVLNNFVERIVTAQAGQIFRKGIMFEDIPDRISNDLAALDIANFTKALTESAVRDGVGFVLVDIPAGGGYPYFTMVHRANVINWDKDESVYKWVVIQEFVQVRDGFKVEYVKQYRHIKEDGNIDIYREVTGKGFQIVESITTSYDFCPLYEARISDIPPLYDIAMLNIAHYNMASILDSCTATAMQPSLFTKGLGIGGGDTIKFSTNSTINTDNEEADVKWLELNGTSIPEGVKNLERKEKDMSERALRLQESGSVKTATQVAEESSESNSRLSDIADTVEQCINEAYDAWHRMKYLSPSTGRVALSRDFKAATDGAANTIIGAYSAGIISQRTAIEALNEAEVISVEDIDKEIATAQAEFTGVVDAAT